MKKLRPIEDMLVVRDLGTASSLELDSSLQGTDKQGQVILAKKEEDPMHIGKVIAVGPGLLVSGIDRYIPMEPKVGDKILYIPSISAAYEYKNDKQLEHLIRYKSVYAIVEEA